MSKREEIALAPKVIEAIKTIAERQGKECPTCIGYGGTDLVKMPGLCATMGKCPTCKGKGKVGWKWEPKPRDEFIATDGSKRFIVNIVSGGVRDDSGYHWSISQITPLLHWEEIERALEGMGYRLTVGVDPGVKPFKTGFECWIGTQEGAQKYEQFAYLKGIKTRQEAVMRAVIEVGSRMKGGAK